MVFKDKVVLITGGTGSFGNAVLKRLLESDVSELRVLSRDEKKQDDMRNELCNEKVKFFIGDVRDISTLIEAFRGVDYCFHAAALKQVPSCEFYPMEAVKTNIIGTNNVIAAAIKNKVKRLICLSTDKAVYPINAMGVSKAMMEKIAAASSRFSDQTIICTTRYGNVMGSRGSVIPLFVSQILNGRPITVTDVNMTRFMMTLDDAVDLVLYALNHGENGDIYVQKAPSATIGTLISALESIFQLSSYPIQNIGVRHGEKLYETLLSREELRRSDDQGSYFRVKSDSRDLNYSAYFDKGTISQDEAIEYNSHNTRRLSESELSSKLRELPFIRESLAQQQNNKRS